jgi:uncharacterized protein (DUF433 family)
MDTIIDRGRGPEIAGTRITVYDILDYVNIGWHHTAIAAMFRISSRQVQAAIQYIEDHEEEVWPITRRCLTAARAATRRNFKPSSMPPMPCIRRCGPTDAGKD